MKKFSKILVPVDFSDESNRALEYAFTLGSGLELDILVLHVVDSRAISALSYSYGAVDNDYLSSHSHEDMAVEVKQVMAKEVEKGITYDHDLNVTTHVRFGVPYDQIIKMAKEKSIDFIIMGATGRTALEEVFMGSVADKVSRRAPCPVFVIRKRETN